MSSFWSRFVRHAVIVGGALAVIGWLLAKAFLLAHQMYSGGAYNPENERVLWQTPLTMATLGVAMTACIDFVTGAFRRKAPVSATLPPSDPAL
jgi:hypothetical protein